MGAYSPDRIVRLLTALASIAYFLAWAGTVLVLVAAPALKLLAADSPDWRWGLEVPAVLRDAEATVPASWGSAQLEVEEVRGVLRLPITMMPWWLFTLVWTHAAVTFGLILLFLHHLRRILSRARDGAPFDAGNAARLRLLGLLLIAIAVLNGIATSTASLTVRRRLTSDVLTVPAGLEIDLRIVLLALVLIALGEVFRRGAELEAEQSLVI